MAKALKKVQKNKKEHYYGIGRRKSAVARVRFFNGGGNVLVNDKKIEDFLPLFSLRDKVFAPLRQVNLEKKFDIKIMVKGGGVRGQADAISLGVARALIKYNKELKKTLKDAGFLTRDPRVKERKKPGLKRARRAPQWKKR